MSRGYKMSKGHSKVLFRSGARRTELVNISGRPMRGGIRL